MQHKIARLKIVLVVPKTRWWDLKGENYGLFKDKIL